MELRKLSINEQMVFMDWILVSFLCKNWNLIPKYKDIDTEKRRLGVSTNCQMGDKFSKKLNEPQGVVAANKTNGC